MHNGLKNIHFLSDRGYEGKSCAGYVICCVLELVERIVDFRPAESGSLCVTSGFKHTLFLFGILPVFFQVGH